MFVIVDNIAYSDVQNGDAKVRYIRKLADFPYDIGISFAALFDVKWR